MIIPYVILILLFTSCASFPDKDYENPIIQINEQELDSLIGMNKYSIIRIQNFHCFDPLEALRFIDTISDLDLNLIVLTLDKPEHSNEYNYYIEKYNFENQFYMLNDTIYEHVEKLFRNWEFNTRVHYFIYENFGGPTPKMIKGDKYYYPSVLLVDQDMNLLYETRNCKLGYCDEPLSVTYNNIKDIIKPEN